MNLIQAIILWHIPGNQAYTGHDLAVEADYSQSGFFYAAQGIGNPVSITGMNPDSVLPFAVLLHIGTLISVCIVYWRDILGLIYEFFASIKEPEALTSTRTPPEECAGL